MKHNLKLLVAATIVVGVSAGCGEVARSGRSPVQPVIVALTAGPDDSTNFNSDVADDETGGVTNDAGQVEMTAILKDLGVPGAPSTPSDLNQITFTRYRVEYTRTDGRREQGVDVPFSFDSGATFTVAVGGTAVAGIDLVRHNAKREAPLAALATNLTKITTIATVTFFGRDLAGNDVSVSGQIGITFGQFVDVD